MPDARGTGECGLFQGSLNASVRREYKKGELMWSASVENDSLLDSDTHNAEWRVHVRALVSSAPEVVVPPRNAIRGVASLA